MTHMTVHMDGTGELRSMGLDWQQAEGKVCALCGTPPGTSNGELSRIGEVVNGGTVRVCASCRSRV